MDRSRSEGSIILWFEAFVRATGISERFLCGFPPTEWAQAGDHHAVPGRLHALLILHACCQTQREAGPSVSIRQNHIPQPGSPRPTRQSLCKISQFEPSLKSKSIPVWLHWLSVSFLVCFAAAGWLRLWPRCPRKSWASTSRRWCSSSAATTRQTRTWRCPTSDTPFAEKPWRRRDGVGGWVCGAGGVSGAQGEFTIQRD